MKALTDYATDIKLQDLTEDQQHNIFNLALYAVNTGDLYRNKFKPTQENLYKKYLSGDYDETQATKAFLNYIPTVLKLYEKEMGERPHLNQNERVLLAQEIKEHYTVDFDLYPEGGYFN